VLLELKLIKAHSSLSNKEAQLSIT